MTDAIRGYSGSQKAALVLMQLGRDRAADVLRRLDEDVAEELAQQIARLQTIDDAVAEAALLEFHARAETGASTTRGGREAAEELLQATFGQERATALLGRLASSMSGRPFEFLDAADPGAIAALVADEMPATIALLLIHLTPRTSSGVLSRLDPARRIAVAQAISTAGSADPEIVGVLADTLRQLVRASGAVPERDEIAGGVQPLVDILTGADPATERAILADLEERDPALAEEVRSRMFSFEDLATLEARDVQQALRGLDPAQLALAIKGASPELVEVIMSNMSERNREAVEAERGYLGAVRKSQVEDARSAIVGAVRQMEADGTLVIRRGEATDEPEEELVD
jgi:flagellar motor switch protein FliG